MKKDFGELESGKLESWSYKDKLILMKRQIALPSLSALLSGERRGRAARDMWGLL